MSLKYEITGVSGDSAAFEPRGKLVETITASKTYDQGDSGKTFAIATDALVQTLPLITAENLGIEFEFINTGADGANIITIAPNALDAFHGTIVNAAADVVANGTVDKDFIHTKATANKGDRIKVRAIALTEWYLIGGVGIWVSQS